MDRKKFQKKKDREREVAKKTAKRRKAYQEAASLDKKQKYLDYIHEEKVKPITNEEFYKNKAEREQEILKKLKANMEILKNLEAEMSLDQQPNTYEQQILNQSTLNKK